MLSHLLYIPKDPFQKQNLGPDLWKLCPSLSVRNAISSPGLPGMWKLPIVFPSSRPAILEYLGSDGNRVPHFLWGCRILSAHSSVRDIIQCGVWHLPQFPCCLTCCQGVRVGSHASCLPITSNVINSMKCLSEGVFMCLSTIKPPDRPWQTHNSVFFFKFPHGARVTSIPKQISTSLASLFHKSHQRLASRHESGDTLCSLLIYLQFSVIKWAKAPGPEDPIDIKSDEAIQM